MFKKNIDLMHYVVQHPVRVHPEASLFDAIHLILVHKVSGLCVVDDANRLLGVLSEMDCLRGVLGATYNDTGIGTVADFMTRHNLHTAKVTDNIVDIASDMLAHKIRRRPVVDEDGMLLGQITIRQILRAVKEFSRPHQRSEVV